MDLKPCPFCGAEFSESNIKKHYIGEVFDEYRCSCGMKSPLLRCGGFLLDWWNNRRQASRVMKKPNECCQAGEYFCQIPMPLNGRIQGIDFCIADIVAAFNAANIRTVASCCGHNEIPGIVSLDDGREITIKWPKK
jgi:hypothetical protein